VSSEEREKFAHENLIYLYDDDDEASEAREEERE
jgi:hypothetical protein